MGGINLEMEVTKLALTIKTLKTEKSQVLLKTPQTLRVSKLWPIRFRPTLVVKELNLQDISKLKMLKMGMLVCGLGSILILPSIIWLHNKLKGPMTGRNTKLS
jgi:hypothetical protein